MGTKHGGPITSGGSLNHGDTVSGGRDSVASEVEARHGLEVLDEHVRASSEALEPKGRRFDSLKQLRGEVRGAVSGALTLAENPHVVGSYARGTMIDSGPSNDFDVMFVLDPRIHGDWLGQESGPRNCLDRVREVLARDPGFSPEMVHVDGNSVRVSTDHGSVDVVPAFPDPRGGYQIPDTSGGQTWRHTDPRMFKRYLDAANRAHNGRVVRITRLVKQWNETHGHHLRSFHLETMVLTHFRNRAYVGGSSDFDELERFYSQLPTYLQTPAVEPVYGERVDSYLTEPEFRIVSRQAIRAFKRIRHAGTVSRHDDADRGIDEFDQTIGGG